MEFTTTDAFWHSPYHCVYEDAAIRLLQFSTGTGTPLLIVPPQAGHHSYIADFGADQSLVQCAIAHTERPVYAIEWKSCTFARRFESVEDLLVQLDTAVVYAGGHVTLVGLCQGGWLSVIYTVLNPDSVASLIIAGAPIDTHAGESVLREAIRLPLSMYRYMVALGSGVMRGEFMLMGWKSANVHTHYVKRYLEPTEKADAFYRWYDHTQHLAGWGWYLWAIEHLFKNNRLGRNELVIAGQHIDLTQITCPVQIVTGQTDDVTPAEQSLALTQYTPATTYQINAGHIGVFMGSGGIKHIWPRLFVNA